VFVLLRVSIGTLVNGDNASEVRPVHVENKFKCEVYGASAEEFTAMALASKSSVTHSVLAQNHLLSAVAAAA
jgi:hypothetical protein